MASPALGAARLEAALRDIPPQAARALQSQLAVSQPTLSRAVSALGDRVVRIGSARATRYALVRDVGRAGHRWPLHRIDQRGTVHDIGALVALQANWWRLDSNPSGGIPVTDPTADWTFRGLPWFLADARPQGFIGRAFARRFGPSIGAPSDPNHWSDDDVLLALIQYGSDLPGDLVVGEHALGAALRERLSATSDYITVAARGRLYADRAARALAGDLVGSSAGGKHPKFAAIVLERQGKVRHVLVKFTDRVTATAGRRRADLLICEHLAAETLQRAGVRAAATQLIEADGRMFLEVTRFDRDGAHGRRGCVSLAALEAERSGLHDRWIDAADRLESASWLSHADAESLRLLWFFGGLIGNNDMHFGNVAMMRTPAPPLHLAPVYDMLPMLHAPTATGEIIERALLVPTPAPRHAAIWTRAAALAHEFWECVASDARVSAGFRRIARGHARSVRDAQKHFSAA